MASAYYGTGLSQSTLAARMGTTSAGTDKSQMVIGMKAASNQTQSYATVTAPAASTLQGALRGDIGVSSKPFAVNTHEPYLGTLSGTPRWYNNHHNNESTNANPVGHWILAYGYSANGTSGKYLDPASGLSHYTASAQTFSYSTTLFVYYLGTTNPKGLIGGIVA